MIKVRHIHKSFGAQPVLAGVDLDIAAGSVTVILGPSGSGKSTLLRCINALERPEQGILQFPDLTVDFAKNPSEAELIALRRRSAMVFQQFNLFAHKNALENVMEGPVQVQKRPVAEVEREARKLLAQVGLAGREGSYAHQLSGGQQQRVAIARALALKPQLLLFDEPTSALDPELVQGILALMRDLARAGWTMVVVSHEIKFALEVASRVLVMNGGRIIETGEPAALLENPRQALTRKYLSSIAR